MNHLKSSSAEAVSKHVYLELTPEHIWGYTFCYLKAADLRLIYLSCRAFQNVIKSNETIARIILICNSSTVDLQTFNASDYYASPTYRLMNTYLPENPHPKILEFIGEELSKYDDIQSIHRYFRNPMRKKMDLCMDSSVSRCYDRLQSYNWWFTERNKDDTNISVFFENLEKFYSYNITKDEIIHLHSVVNRNRFKYRKLNSIELSLFSVKPNECHSKLEHLRNNDSNSIVFNKSEFITNMYQSFEFGMWRDAIDWNEYFIAGGGVLHCISKDLYTRFGAGINCGESIQDLDIFGLCKRSFVEFKNNIESIICRIVNLSDNIRVIMVGKDLSNELFMANNYPYLGIFDIYLHLDVTQYPTAVPFEYGSQLLKIEKETDFIEFVSDTVISEQRRWIKLQFINPHRNRSAFNILRTFDLDCCSVGFDGTDVLCSRAFAQALSTQTQICYKMNRIPDFMRRTVDRICKYENKGFALLIPQSFGLDAYQSLAKEIMDPSQSSFIPSELLNYIGDRHFNNSKNYCSNIVFQPCNDSFGIRQKFIQIIQSKM